MAMLDAGFNASISLYVASGLLTYGAEKGMPLLKCLFSSQVFPTAGK